MKNKIIILIILIFCCKSFLFTQTKFINNTSFSSYFNYYNYNTDSPLYYVADTSEFGDFVTNCNNTTQLVAFHSNFYLDASLKIVPETTPVFSLNDCWVKIALFDGFSLSLGRFNINWNDGGIWNISDVLNYKKNWNSNENISGKDGIEFQGVLNILSLPIDINFVTIYYDDLSTIPFCLSIGTIIYPFEFNAKFCFYQNYYPSSAFVIKSNFKSFDFLFSSILLYNNFILSNFTSTASIDYAYRFSPEIDYSLELFNSIFVKFKLSYLFQSDGLTKNDGQEYFDSLYSLYSDENISEYYNLSALLGDNLFRLYRQYLYFELYVSKSEKYDFDLNLYYNLEDFSGAAILSSNIHVGHLFDITPSISYVFGTDNTEGNFIPYSFLASLGLKKSF